MPQDLFPMAVDDTFVKVFGRYFSLINASSGTSWYYIMILLWSYYYLIFLLWFKFDIYSVEINPTKTRCNYCAVGLISCT